jgi:hypothetical protein
LAEVGNAQSASALSAVFQQSKQKRKCHPERSATRPLRSQQQVGAQSKDLLFLQFTAKLRRAPHFRQQSVEMGNAQSASAVAVAFLNAKR